MDITTINKTQQFLDLASNKLEEGFAQVTEDQWKKRSEKCALDLFHRAAGKVPAYAKFLKKNSINPSKIKSYDDFKNIPPTDKKNYIDLYPLEALVWDGKLGSQSIMNSSSGTTGEPYFWPCSEDQVTQGALIKEIIYTKSFEIDKYTTLLMICFGMGTWIAGSYTLATSQLVSQKGYPLTIITPGFNKRESLKILKVLAPKFQQTIIAGIPTFVKDLLEEWSEQEKTKEVGRIKLLFAGEGFSESWREYVLNLVGSRKRLSDVVSILGSAETAIMGFETPLSILVRKIASGDPSVKTSLFSDERLPSLQNYIPTMRFFESTDEGELIITADRGVPLIRYNLHDQGGLLSFAEVESSLKRNGYDINDQLKESGVNDDYFRLPFVYTFGRGKFVAILYGVNIYPENVREVLMDEKIRKFVTGKFIAKTQYDKVENQYLQLNVELAEKVQKNDRLARSLAEVFVKKVKALNSEYNRMSEEYGSKAIPQVVLYEYGDRELFPKGVFKKTS